MKKVILASIISIILMAIAFLLAGCGGGGGSKKFATGSIEGYVYVPEQGGRNSSSVRLTREATPPLGYSALYGAEIKVEIDGRVVQTRTDRFGHFKVEGLPTGQAKVTVTPPLSGPIGLAEFFTFTTTMEVKANTTAYIGADGNISLISISADHLEVTVNQIDTADFPTVRAYISVVDPIRNTPIIGLAPNNFEILVADQAATEINLSQQASHSASASVSLVLDRSGSMNGDNGDDQPLKDLQKATKEFIGFLGSGDRAEIISFADEVRSDCPFTSDKSTLTAAIEQLQTGGSTALYDAIQKGIRDAALEANPRKAIIVMTDGGENNSTSATLDSVINLAKQAGVPVYTIGLQGFDFTRSVRSGAEISRLGREVRSSRKVRSEEDLQRIARETGGEYFYSPQSSDLMGIYTKITQRQQQQYVVAFRDPKPQERGWRSLKIKVQAAGLEGNGSSEYGHALFDYPVNRAAYIPGSYNGRTFYYDNDHLGEDIELPEGTPIRAIGGGRIVQYEAHQGYGELCAVIEHDLEKIVHFDLDVGDTKTVDTQFSCSIYGHIRASQTRDSANLPWKVGDRIGQGQIIGYINDAAHNGEGGEHLHMGVRLKAHPGRWVYYGHDTVPPDSSVVNFAAFSEVISTLNQ